MNADTYELCDSLANKSTSLCSRVLFLHRHAQSIDSDKFNEVKAAVLVQAKDLSASLDLLILLVDSMSPSS